jgi:hypothetical protein
MPAARECSRTPPWFNDARYRRPVGSIANFAADLQYPSAVLPSLIAALSSSVLGVPYRPSRSSGKELVYYLRRLDVTFAEPVSAFYQARIDAYFQISGRIEGRNP